MGKLIQNLELKCVKRSLQKAPCVDAPWHIMSGGTGPVLARVGLIRDTRDKATLTPHLYKLFSQSPSDTTI